MRLSWNEITARAGKFATDWSETTYEKGESQSFWTELLEVFGVNRRRAGGYFEYGVKLAGKKYGFIDMFLPGKLLVEQKSAGRDLSTAQGQALGYLDGIVDYDLPEIIIACDFQSFQILDLNTRETTSFPLVDLPKHVRMLAVLVDEKPQKYEEQNPVNREAAERMAALHNVLSDSGYNGHKLELLLVRLVFCLFAEDSQIFTPRQFENFIRDRTDDDGTDLGPRLNKLFEILNTPIKNRSSKLDEDIAAFPYINGGLFAETTVAADFDAPLRLTLLQASRPDWSKVSPAIFGGMFQGVMDEKKRHDIGAHYTSEENILRVIKPLFLDDLYAEFEPLATRRRRTHQERREDARTRERRLGKLHEFHSKIANLDFLDPACGCGNFLVIAYRELRRLEHRVVAAMSEGTALLDVRDLLNVRVEQFHGIEIEEFPALVARTALWLTDHQMNLEASAQLGMHYTRLPLTEGANIHWSNALTRPWADMFDASEIDYIMGNPPFNGSRTMEKEQKAELKAVAKGFKHIGFLDYVTAWYILADRFLDLNPKIEVALVSTNSIAQGEQPGIVWPTFFEHGNHINFAHRTFRWMNGAPGEANVHCVIVGFGRNEREQKQLFDYPDVSGEPILDLVDAISPYLISGDEHVVTNRGKQISGEAEIAWGNMPADKGNLLLSETERADLILKEPQAEKWIYPCLGSREFLRSKARYCLWLEGSTLGERKAMPLVLQRIALVQEVRKESARPDLAEIPHLFAQRTQKPTQPFLLIPAHSSARRDYVPMGFYEAGTVATNACLVIPNAEVWQFAVLTSRMHMAWLGVVGGRIKSDFRYSKDVVYNNFVFPQISEADKQALTELGQRVLTARSAEKGESMSNLYDPLLMPRVLRKAHTEVDKFVDGLYQVGPFEDSQARVRHLLTLHKTRTAASQA
ncbi:DNA methyltransferase [Pseudoclavibacter sp. Z016]|uniref:DNA methyltransferase n=1 Tax=Pseudoclavibacter sp. Z016 TaxID=2080581 RepID=UPI0011B02964|nr:DNA methyltransferase [Pseudoclavibacter sp. Z016]